ncbi:hypothetical protein RSAG8_00305, partial [Rhizoctonia solani AG-8 WAC10335]
RTRSTRFHVTASQDRRFQLHRESFSVKSFPEPPSLSCNSYSLFSELKMSGITLSPNATCVYCGSSPGTSPEYMQVAEAVGKALAQAGIGLVYGGGRRGLMGGVAFACAQAGGNVTGVLPQAIKSSGGEGTGPILASTSDKDEAVWVRTESIVVQSMHERKKTMAMHSGIDTHASNPSGGRNQCPRVLRTSQITD